MLFIVLYFLLPLPSISFPVQNNGVIDQKDIRGADDNEEQPWLNSGKFEGDIDVDFDTFRNAMGDLKRRWKDGIVAYEIRPELGQYPGLEFLKNTITNLQNKVNEAGPCITMKPRDNEKAFISFYKGDGCHSRVGSNGSKQDISLGTGCYNPSTIHHEILHALGFYHEQSRPDRDQYVTIHEENIIPGQLHQFNKISSINSLGTPYSYNSIMHYISKAWSKNGKVTISSKDPSVHSFRGPYLSEIDIERVRLLYNCSTGDNTPTTSSTPPDVYPCNDVSTACNTWAAQGFCQENVRTMARDCPKACGIC